MVTKGLCAWDCMEPTGNPEPHSYPWGGTPRVEATAAILSSSQPARGSLASRAAQESALGPSASAPLCLCVGPSVRPGAQEPAKGALPKAG